jgi:hypothetical protein
MYGIMVFLQYYNFTFIFKNFQPTLRSFSSLRPAQIVEFDMRIITLDLHRVERKHLRTCRRVEVSVNVRLLRLQ